MLETILRNQRIILEVLRHGTDVTWLKEEIDERIHYTNEELSKLHKPTVISTVCEHNFVTSIKEAKVYTCVKCDCQRVEIAN